MQRGHGSVALAVRNTSELSGTDPLKSPVVVLIEPLVGDANVLRTQVDVPAFEIGRNVPNWQPVFEQLLLLPVSTAVRALTTQLVGPPVIVNCVSAPPGVGPSATVEVPPPM